MDLPTEVWHIVIAYLVGVSEVAALSLASRGTQWVAVEGLKTWLRAQTMDIWLRPCSQDEVSFLQTHIDGRRTCATMQIGQIAYSRQCL